MVLPYNKCSSIFCECIALLHYLQNNKVGGPHSMSRALRKQQRLEKAKLLLFQSINKGGITDEELAQALCVHHTTAYRYRDELGAVKLSLGKYALRPTESDIALAQAVLQAKQL
jgi:hypothetical protein